jgi:hypothetical protein
MARSTSVGRTNIKFSQKGLRIADLVRHVCNTIFFQSLFGYADQK